jgi:hypothetical protein
LKYQSPRGTSAVVTSFAVLYALCAAALADAQQLKELREIVKGQQHFLVLPAFEPKPIRERFQEGMSNAARNIMIWQQQKVASFAAGSDKETLQVLSFVFLFSFILIL